ncbi:outer membrane protein assembly factor BamC [Vibrio cincinnatiensis]|uniref:outer membrane protein assembly factor BamC n=1 Tax=Vibrio cincinnatiensis TaxID=675 RepID=UPI001EDD69FD|nr:outer membrane protein assembly factor BamC [Vibrio cincinnatiensis]MCG3732413.1 outer membrane protein assembly factor BamC [Vibrio cincinnatiensis]MCG3738546.1 outer membrane protein assembly factor BamC [Vibrio cincinnatiensis]
MKLSRQLVVGSLAVLVLSACSSSPAQRRQAKNDFTYLETKPFTPWVLPEGATPQYYPNYEIPKGEFVGAVGGEVDIRPPQQILELIPGARSERQDGDSTLWMIRQDEVDTVWQTALSMLQERGVKVRKQTDNYLETDWVNWSSEDEDTTLGSRYEFSRVTANNRFGFRVSLIDWRENGKVVPVSTTNKERYNIFMTNLVTSRYDQYRREEAARRAEELVKQIPITMGADRSGLPVIIARTPYEVLWQRIPTLMPSMGFTIEERNQSQGTIKARYASPDDEFWYRIGVKPMNLRAGTYTFLLGDLGNRTSINVTNSAGRPVEQELLQEMVPVLAAMVQPEE